MKQILKTSLILTSLLTLLFLTPANTFAQDENLINTEFHQEQIITADDGNTYKLITINGPSEAPDNMIQHIQTSLAEGDVVLPNFPDYAWNYGCTPTAAAMIAGWYDSHGFEHLYTGPSNNGVAPIDDSFWTPWTDGYKYYPANPISGSKMGHDGRESHGSIDSYWIKYLNLDPDPYIVNEWDEHEYDEAIGDYMKTGQSKLKRRDGASTFMFGQLIRNNGVVTCEEIYQHDSWKTKDAMLGLKHYYEAQDYNVGDCYNAYTDNISNQNGQGSFTFQDFMNEIDNGHPVLVNLYGHSIVAYGYNEAEQKIMIRTTWSSAPQQIIKMDWGGTLGTNMRMHGVVIVHPMKPSGEDGWNPPEDYTNFIHFPLIIKDL